MVGELRLAPMLCAVNSREDDDGGTRNGKESLGRSPGLSFLCQCGVTMDREPN
jgi:hypothetical protein